MPVSYQNGGDHYNSLHKRAAVILCMHMSDMTSAFFAHEFEVIDNDTLHYKPASDVAGMNFLLT